MICGLFRERLGFLYALFVRIRIRQLFVSGSVSPQLMIQWLVMCRFGSGWTAAWCCCVDRPSLMGLDAIACFPERAASTNNKQQESRHWSRTKNDYSQRSLWTPAALSSSVLPQEQRRTLKPQTCCCRTSADLLLALAKGSDGGSRGLYSPCVRSRPHWFLISTNPWHAPYHFRDLLPRGKCP